MDPISTFVFNHLVGNISAVLMPLMILTFMAGVSLRLVIFYIAKVENKFSREFEKRVRYFFSTTEPKKSLSFFRVTRILLDKTYYDCFAKREKFKRRNFDYTLSFLDRVFLLEDGVKRLIEDNLRQIRHFRKDAASVSSPPKMVEVVKMSFEVNPYFNRIGGVIPVNVLHEFLNILPGLFLVGGIFGTFLGISKGLPELGGMDLGNMGETKRVMDLFLVQISQAMVKSILGIGFSAAMTMINTVLATEATFFNGVNRYVAALEQLWNESTNNEVDVEAPAPVNMDQAA